MLDTISNANASRAKLGYTKGDTSYVYGVMLMIVKLADEIKIGSSPPEPATKEDRSVWRKQCAVLPIWWATTQAHIEEGEEKLEPIS